MLEISFAKPELPEEGILLLLLAEGAELSGPVAALDKALKGGLKRALEAAEFTGKKGQQASLLAPGKYKKILVLGTGKAEGPQNPETLGGAIAASCAKESAVAVLASGPAQAAKIAFGARLRAYRFDKYRTTQKDDEKPKFSRLTVLTPTPQAAEAAYKTLAAVAHGVEFTRDLVTEPANVLYPEEFADRAESLKKLGLKVDIFWPERAGKTRLRHAALGFPRVCPRAAHGGIAVVWCRP